MEEIRLRYEAYREERERARWLVHSGRKSDPGLAEIDDRYADLTEGEPLDVLRAQLETRSFDSQRDSDRRLIRLVEDAVLEARRFSLGRELLARRAHGETSGLDELCEERFVELGRARQKLGYANGRARVEAHYPGVDLAAWASAAERVLDVSEPHYRDAVRAALSSAGVAPGQERPHHVLAIARRSRGDRYFAPERLADCLDHSTSGLGLRLEDAPGVSLDLVARPGRAAEAELFRVCVPGEIVLSAAPSAGRAAYAERFAASGRAFAAAFVSSELPLERRRGLDPGLAWGWAALFAQLLDDPLWAREGPAAQRAAGLVQEDRLRRLLGLRVRAARLRFELALAELPGGSDPHGLAEKWAEELTNALGVGATPEGYLESADAELASLHELRGSVFAYQFAEWLRERYGRAFWRERAAGALLKELWHTGSTYRAEDVAREIGFAPLDPELLLSSLLAGG